MPTKLKIELDASKAEKDLEAFKAKVESLRQLETNAKTVSQNGGSGSGAADTALKRTERQAKKTSEKIKDIPDATKGAMSKLGEQIGKGATAIGALGAAAGASVPPLGALAAVVSALTAPIALVTAAIGALATLATEVWDYMTVSAEEYAEKTRIASEEAQKHAEKVKEQDQAAQGYVDRLKEMAGIENAGNSVKAETAQILATLQNLYGDLGAEIDANTGKVKNLLEVEQRLNAERNKRKVASLMKQSDAYMDETRAAYMKAKGSEWETSEWEAKGMFEGMRKSMSPEQMLKHFRDLSKKATRSAEATGYADAANKLEASIKARKQAGNLAATGYESEEAKAADIRKREAAAGDAQRRRDAAKNRSSDQEFADLKDIDAKKANRQARIDEVRQKRKDEGLDDDLEKAKADVAKARESGDKGMLADALKAQYEAELKIQNSLDQEAALKRQIEDLDKARAEAVKKITGQAEYELEYNKLIAAGEFEKAAALKLEKELKDQNLKLTDEEKNKILEQRAALDKLSTEKQIADAKENVRLQQLLVDGKYEEYELEKLKLEARRQGRNLTDEEAKVLREQLEAQRQLEAQKRLDESRAELEIQRAILNGEYAKAEALRLQLEQKKANRQYSEAELEEIKKQNAERQKLALGQSLQDQAYSARYAAMQRAGLGREAEQEKALRDAEKTKGAKLTQEESALVQKLAELNYTMQNPGRTALDTIGGAEIKTNSLTARGGFSGGAVAPDKDRINRAIEGYNKRMAAQLEAANRLLGEIKTGLTG